MPGLTVDTSHTPSHGHPQTSSKQPLSSPTDASHSHSHSSSPIQHPPYSPLTPTLASARLPVSTSSTQQPTQSRHLYTHSQPPQTSIPQPAPIEISLDSNPDALALKAAISILQIQKRRAEEDVRALQRIKERALADPEGFAGALGRDDMKLKSNDLFTQSADDDEDADEDEDEEEAADEPSQTNPDVLAQSSSSSNATKWPPLPTPQNIVRCPPINWTQYAVIGESLDKLHADQQARPAAGMPARVGPDGGLIVGGEGARRERDLGVASPYLPGRDRVERERGLGRKGKK